MFSTYRAVFRVPGPAAFCAAGFLMRLPLAPRRIGTQEIVEIIGEGPLARLRQRLGIAPLEDVAAKQGPFAEAPSPTRTAVASATLQF